MFDMRCRNLCIACGKERRGAHLCDEFLHVDERELRDRSSRKDRWRIAYRQRREQERRAAPGGARGRAG